MRCAHCGSKVKREDIYCKSCGAAIDQSQEQSHISSNPPSAEKKWRQSFVSTAIMIVAVLVVLGMAFFIVSRSEMPSSQDNPATQTETPSGNENTALSTLEGMQLVAQDEESARAAVLAAGDALGLGDLSNTLGTCRAEKFLDDTYYRFSQKIDAYTVHAKSLVLHVGPDGSCKTVTNNFCDLSNALVSKNISVGDALRAVAGNKGEPQEMAVTGTCVYADGDTVPTLCYEVVVCEGTSARSVFVSASDAKVLGQEEIVQSVHAEGTGNTLREELGPVTINTNRLEDGSYEMYDTIRKIKVYDAHGAEASFHIAFIDQNNNLYRGVSDYEGHDYALVSITDGRNRTVIDENDLEIIDVDGVIYRNAEVELRLVGIYLWSDDSPSLNEEGIVRSSTTHWDNSGAVSVLYHLERTHDFFAEVLGRNGFDGAGEWGLRVCINGLANDTDNAQACAHQIGRVDSTIVFGADTLAWQDVAAHEYAHLVTRYVSNPSSKGEAAALNEAISDIYGELVEDYAIDEDMENRCDWVNNYRSLRSPKSKGDYADTYRGEHWKVVSNPEDSDENSVFSHHNSTVISHAAYLMCNRENEKDTVGKLLTTKELAQVLYATQGLMSANTNFYSFAAAFRYQASTMLSLLKYRRVIYAFERVAIGRPTSKAIAISTAEELDAVRQDLAGEYELIADIDLSGRDWTPLGDFDHPFTGTFEGNGCTISGLHVREYSETSRDVGLFGVINGGAVYNLKLKDVDVLARVDNPERLFSNVGGLSGQLIGGTVSGCKVSGVVESQAGQGTFARAGALIGGTVQQSHISNCYTDAEVIAHAYGANAMAGGVVAWLAESTVDCCLAEGSVNSVDDTAVVYAGGIAASGGDGTINNSAVVCNIIAATGDAGVVSPCCEFSNISSCLVADDIKGNVSHVDNVTYCPRSTLLTKAKLTENGWDFFSFWEETKLGIGLQ